MLTKGKAGNLKAETCLAPEDHSLVQEDDDSEDADEDDLVDEDEEAHDLKVAEKLEAEEDEIDKQLLAS